MLGYARLHADGYENLPIQGGKLGDIYNFRTLAISASCSFLFTVRHRFK
jgi:hypothetical protein